jgi:hypothetical protein
MRMCAQSVYIRPILRHIRIYTYEIRMCETYVYIRTYVLPIPTNVTSVHSIYKRFGFMSDGPGVAGANMLRG